VQLLVWSWAGIANLINGDATSYKFAALVSSNPFVSEHTKKRMYKDWPKNLSASPLAFVVTRLTACVEGLFPFMIVCGGIPAAVGRFLGCLIHIRYLLNMACGMSLERITSSLAMLFVVLGPDAQWSLRDLSLSVGSYLLAAHIVLPILGHLKPTSAISFLACRSFSGTLPSSVWLIDKNALEKLNSIISYSALPQQQLKALYHEDSVGQFEYRFLVGRMMAEFSARTFCNLLPKAVQRIARRTSQSWIDSS
jgi:hypothetical protein